LLKCFTAGDRLIQSQQKREGISLRIKAVSRSYGRIQTGMGVMQRCFPWKIKGAIQIPETEAIGLHQGVSKLAQIGSG
jgi:hypothetical protein